MKRQKEQEPKAQQERQPQRLGQGEANSAPAAPPGNDTKQGDRAVQHDRKKGQAARQSSANVQQSAANVEESPRMDRGDSAGGAGESHPAGRDAAGAGDSMRRGALDTQYGTRSGMKSEASQPARSGSSGSSDSSDSSGAGGTDTEPPEAPNPGSSEESTGADRDTMSGPRPGGRS
jgi:hypothetical protein